MDRKLSLAIIFFFLAIWLLEHFGTGGCSWIFNHFPNPTPIAFEALMDSPPQHYNTMHTCSSPSHLEDSDAIAELITGTANKRCDWSQQDEADLIDFLIECKGEMAETASFKQSTWTGAAQHLEKSCIKGSPKTSKACSKKWSRVHRTAFQ